MKGKFLAHFIRRVDFTLHHKMRSSGFLPFHAYMLVTVQTIGNITFTVNPLRRELVKF